MAGSKPLPSLVDGAKEPVEPEQKPATERYQLASKSLKEKTYSSRSWWKGRRFIYSTLHFISFSRSEFYLFKEGPHLAYYSLFKGHDLQKLSVGFLIALSLK